MKKIDIPSYKETLPQFYTASMHDYPVTVALIAPQHQPAQGSRERMNTAQSANERLALAGMIHGYLAHATPRNWPARRARLSLVASRRAVRLRWRTMAWTTEQRSVSASRLRTDGIN